MFKKLFGKSETVSIPDNIRTNVEGELVAFRSVLILAEESSVFACTQTMQEASETYESLNRNTSAMEKIINEIDKLWPEGKESIDDLRTIVNLMPEWLANHQKWTELSKRSTQFGEELDISKYQHHVIENRKYSTQIEECLLKAQTKLLKFGFDFEVIEARSRKSLEHILTKSD